MPEPRDESKPDKDKEKKPKTKPMPLDAAQDFTEWVKKQPIPTPDDKGEVPPIRPKIWGNLGSTGPPSRGKRGYCTMINYLHCYANYRPDVDWNTCGTAAIATVTDYWGRNPYNLNRTARDSVNGLYYWNDSEAIDAIRIGGYGPDVPFGFGTSGMRIQKELRAKRVRRLRGSLRVWLGRPLAIAAELSQLEPPGTGDDRPRQDWGAGVDGTMGDRLQSRRRQDLPW